MKTNPLTKLATLLAVAVVAVGFTATASADSMIFKPITTMKAAANLKVGTKVAIICDNGRAVFMMDVDADRTYLRGFKCPFSGKQFTALAPGGGGRGNTVYYTAPNGLTAYLAAPR